MNVLIPIFAGKGQHTEVVAYALVDAQDAVSLRGRRWGLQRAACGLLYTVRYDKSRPVLMHRQILNATDRRVEVDHRDHDGLNNTRANLRLATHAQNMQNRRKHRNGRTSPERGVHWDKKLQRWRANVKLNGRYIWRRSFVDHDAAAIAVKDARQKFFTHATN